MTFSGRSFLPYSCCQEVALSLSFHSDAFCLFEFLYLDTASFDTKTQRLLPKENEYQYKMSNRLPKEISEL
jgi:hypothetical protein